MSVATPVLTDDLKFLVTPLEIALNAGLRKEELLSINPEHLNFTGLPTFYNGREVIRAGCLFQRVRTAARVNCR